MKGSALYIFALVAVAGAFSFSVLMGESVRLDEAQSVWQTSRDLGGVLHVIAKDVHMPLYFVILHYWEAFFGTSEAAIRSLSLLFFLASIPAVYRLASAAYSHRVAVYASFLCALSPFLNWYGSEARMYSLLFLVTVLSHLSFILLWREPRRGLWVGYGFVTLLGVLTHPFFAFIVVSQALFFFARRDVFGEGPWLKGFGGVAVVVGVSGAFWIWYRNVAGAGLSNPLLSPPTSADFFNVFSNFFIGFQTDAVNTFVLSLWPLLVFAAFTLISRKKQSEPETSYFLIASFLPIALAILVSLTYRPVFLSRYLVVSLPSIYLLSVHFLSSYKKRAGEIALAALSAAAVLMLVLQTVDPGSPVKEDYRSVARYVEARADADDLFVVSAPFLTYPVEYYYRGAPRLATFPRWQRYTKDNLPEPYSPELIERDSAGWAKVYEHVYLLLGYDQGYEEEVRIYMDEHFERVGMETFSPGLSLYIYRLRYL
ncbi:MAG: glycosyltransferase family 39 protein [Candidatus Taylorbacteria bacterium]|nr:glycosyltransferase family 39 protein [Candidatus Taylorbacteria bacterium]